MKIEPSLKMNAFQPSVFTDLKTYVTQKKQEGKELIDLSLGSPDLAPGFQVRKTLSEKSLQPFSYGYTLGGTNRFYQAVADYYQKRSNVILDPDTQILQTMGSQEGLVHLPLAFCNPGDTVLVTNPAYVAYEAGINLAGAVPAYMPLREENGFLPDLSAISEEVARKAKLMILNVPGNPVPAMPTPAFFKEAVAFARKYNVLIVHDAAYSEFYFSGSRPISFLSADGALDTGIEVNSLSKSFSLAGARIAYMAGNAEMIRILKQLKSNLDYGVFEPVQEAAITALQQAEQLTDSLREEFSARADALTKGLSEIGWMVEKPGGGMFIWAKIPFGSDDRAFVFKAIDEAGVVMTPGSAFGSAGTGYVRIALVQPVPVLRAAADNLQAMMIST